MFINVPAICSKVSNFKTYFLGYGKQLWSSRSRARLDLMAVDATVSCEAMKTAIEEYLDEYNQAQMDLVCQIC